MDTNLELYRSLLNLGPVERYERLLHLPRSERFRVASIVEREKLNRRLQERLAGRDLVEMALSNPSEFHDNVLLQNALLGRTSFYPDEAKMIQRIVGAQYSGEGLFDKIANFDQKYYVTMPIDAWKLVYCDLCYIDGANSRSLQDIYESRLREEELQTPAARARENIRRDVIKTARRNAKWVLSELDRLSDEEKAQPLEDFGETAYDADWDSSTEETVSSSGEKYQGRVKVSVYSLNAWFYAARWEGISLRDMWLKAQTLEDEIWICHTMEMDQWNHEPWNQDDAIGFLRHKQSIYITTGTDE
ncbi:hypothetical protein LB504_010925 [Fusarium proliferatum]|nr:hypothetical protein LB504_010925 [Fusarium proliferatum]